MTGDRMQRAMPWLLGVTIVVFGGIIALVFIGRNVQHSEMYTPKAISLMALLVVPNRPQKSSRHAGHDHSWREISTARAAPAQIRHRA